MRSLTPFKIVFLYIIFSLAYIVLSDELVGALFTDQRMYTKVSILKGGIFILLTGMFFYSCISLFGRQKEESEARLLQSENRYRAIVENQTEFVARYVSGGILTYVNETLCRYAGIPRQALIGRSFLDFFHPEDREEWAHRFASLTRENPVVTAEARIILPDGRNTWHNWTHTALFDADGRFLEYQATGRDITHVKEADEARNHSEKLLKAIVDTEPECVKIIDRDSNLIMMNRAGLDMIEAESLEQVNGHSVLPMVTPEFREAFENLNKKVFQGEKGSLLFEMIGLRGRHLWLETHAVPFRNEKNEIVALLGITRDVTEKRKMEEELLKTQKLESLGILAGGIAHDFNNLLQGVFGYVSLAKESLNEPNKAFTMLDQAEKALKLSVNLSRQLLTFSKGGKPVRNHLLLTPVIENAARFALSGTNSQVEVFPSPDLWPIFADEGQVSQVIQNIVRNANEAMSGGGLVSISLENRDLAGSSLALLPDGGKFVRIDIRDTGHGMTEAIKRKIFDPFFTTKEKGTGLGLATSYSIVKNHGGAIDVESTPGKGTTFSIYLPACDSVLPAEPLSARQGNATHAKILIMDDEEMIRHLTGLMIESLGHEVDSAADGQEAIEKYQQAKNSGKPFDLVILDLTVKDGMGGEQAIARLREFDPNVKAVVSSGYSDDNEVAAFQSHGFAAFLNKPYHLDTLKKCLNSLLK